MNSFFDFSISRLSSFPHGIEPFSQNTADDLAEMDGFPPAISSLARGRLAMRERHQRVAVFLTTQPRRLFFHALLALHFQARNNRSEEAASHHLTRRDFDFLAVRHSVASRTWADGFFGEALQSGVITLAEGASGAGTEAIVPSLSALDMLKSWYEAHFKALDFIDGGCRVATFLAQPDDMLARLQPLVARLFPLISHVSYSGDGATTIGKADVDAVLMDMMAAGIDWEKSRGHEMLLADVEAILDLVRLSDHTRFDLARQFIATELLGIVGWIGQRGRSAVWISRDFFREYARSQAATLCIVNDAFAEATGTCGLAEANTEPFDAEVPFGFPNFKNGVIDRSGIKDVQCLGAAVC